MAEYGRLARAALLALGCVVLSGASEPCDKSAVLLLAQSNSDQFYPADYVFAFRFDGGGTIVCDVELSVDDEVDWACDNELMTAEWQLNNLYFHFDGYFPGSDPYVSIWRDDELLLSEHQPHPAVDQFFINEDGGCGKQACEGPQIGSFPLMLTDG